ncbi:S-adenosyl-L-methionine-dependent methyltransferase [Limtongia smithiae]|uniref:S-adenosyl-L-methionine-dependent methyltransferase n=1 Tax=Limtongia smithiae TaxID=1125753 RepID=UPI0034CDA513
MSARFCRTGVSRIAHRMLSTAIPDAAATVHPTSLSAFDSNHDLYDQFRPTHYAPAVDKLIASMALPAKGASVVDLASGTGKFTALLRNRGFDLSAVEISDGMLKTFREKLPDVPAFKGSSYEIPFPSGSLDALFCAQAFHWFADMASLREMHRVLKPGTGKLALIWNYEPEPEHNEKWQLEVAEECWQYDLDLPQFRRMNWQDVFETSEAGEQFQTPLEKGKVYWSYKIRPQDVYKLWLTKSYITRLDKSEKAKVKNRIDQILTKDATHLVDDQGFLDLKMGVYYTWTTRKN